MAMVQELHPAYNNGYGADQKCPRCEAFTLKIAEYKQMLSCKNNLSLPLRKAETTSLWLRKGEAVALRQAKLVKIHCYECKENEEALEWYQCLYKMPQASITTSAWPILVS